MKKGFKRTLLVLALLGIILFLIGISYAYWLVTKKQTNSNVVTAKCLDISLRDDSNDINVTNKFPISDEEGMSTTPYTFTITNNCNTEIDYQVSLESIGDESTSLHDSSIKVVIDNNKIRTLNNYKTVDPTIENAYSSHKIATGTLAASNKEGASKTHNLRLWIDHDVTVAEANKTFNSKITVTAGQGIENVICKSTTSETVTTGNIPEGNYNYGDEYICNVDGTNDYHFFVLENGDNTTLTKGVTGTTGLGEVSLIMNQNIGNPVEWVTYEDFITTGDNLPWNHHTQNYKGPITASAYLMNQTLSWEMIAGLPTYEQLLSANNSMTTNLPMWLIDYLGDTDNSPKDNPRHLFGYWTRTPAKVGDSSNSYAYTIRSTNSLTKTFISDSPTTTLVGVRPIITISKSVIK